MHSLTKRVFLATLMLSAIMIQFDNVSAVDLQLGSVSTPTTGKFLKITYSCNGDVSTFIVPEAVQLQQVWSSPCCKNPHTSSATIGYTAATLKSQASGFHITYHSSTSPDCTSISDLPVGALSTDLVSISSGVIIRVAIL
jgi:hypothetical protein